MRTRLTNVREGGAHQGPQTTDWPALDRQLSPEAWRIRGLTPVGMEGRTGKGIQEPPIINLLCIHPESRCQPSLGLEGQSIALRLWASLHPFP